MKRNLRATPVAGHLLLAAIVALWMIPTVGLLVSSFRTNAQISASGWWTAFSTRTYADTQRTKALEGVARRDGKIVLDGRLFDETSGIRIHRFSLKSASPGEFAVGSTVVIADAQPLAQADGTLSVGADSSYHLVLNATYPGAKGLPISFIAESPPSFSLRNYQRVLGAEGLGQAFVNSFKLAIPATIIPLLIAACAAYAFSWMRFAGRRWLFVLIVGLLVVPLQISLIPTMRLYASLAETLDVNPRAYPAVWLLHTAFAMPMAIYLLRNAMATLPRELIDSALLDGASHFDIFRHIVLPLSVPALLSLAVFQFLWVWNDFLVALVFMGKQPDNIVLTIRLFDLLGCRGYSWHLLTASAFISIAVPIGLFFALQRHFARGLVAVSVRYD